MKLNLINETDLELRRNERAARAGGDIEAMGKALRTRQRVGRQTEFEADKVTPQVAGLDNLNDKWSWKDTSIPLPKNWVVYWMSNYDLDDEEEQEDGSPLAKLSWATYHRVDSNWGHMWSSPSVRINVSGENPERTYSIWVQISLPDEINNIGSLEPYEGIWQDYDENLSKDDMTSIVEIALFCPSLKKAVEVGIKHAFGGTCNKGILTGIDTQIGDHSGCSIDDHYGHQIGEL